MAIKIFHRTKCPADRKFRKVKILTFFNRTNVRCAALFQGLEFVYCNATHLQYFFHSQAGPNAPLQWVRESVQALSPDSNEQRKKVFVGLNFYGMDYSPSGGSGTAMDYNGYLVDLHGGRC